LRTLEEIVDEWKGEFGILGRGKNGPYRYIDYSQKKDLLMTLVRTLIDEGYDQNTLKSTRTANLIINACEAPDGASSRSSGKIRKSKQITASNLKFVLTEFFRGPFSSHNPQQQNATLPPSPQTTFQQPKSKEKILEIDPTDRIKIDTSDIADNPLDPEFLKEIGLSEDFMSGKKDE